MGEAQLFDIAPNPHALRVAEALLFAATGPLAAEEIAPHLPEGADVAQVLAELEAVYAHRGVTLVRVAGKWMFRTAPDLGHLLRQDREEPRKLSRAALETLAIIAYHQPVTRAEIEQIRGVATSRGTLDVLIEAGWVRSRGRRRTPGRPGTWGVTEAFLAHFGLASIDDLPGLDELKAAGLLDSRPPIGPGPVQVEMDDLHGEAENDTEEPSIHQDSDPE